MSTKKIIVTGLAVNAVILAGSTAGYRLLREPLEKLLFEPKPAPHQQKTSKP